MRPLTIPLLFLLISAFTPGGGNAAWAEGGKPLAVIDGQMYSAEDYEHWWEHWRDTENQQPESATPFIEWSLLVREAERMELSTVPEFRHKVEVFLKARTLMALKYDEIDTKVSISEDDLKAAYERDYGPRRTGAGLADDYAQKRETIKRELSKKQEDSLSAALIQALMKKYQVRVDEQVLQEIDLVNPEANDLQQVVVDSDRSQVTVAYLIEQCRKGSDFTHKPPGNLAAQRQIKKQIVNAMIANSLVSWEALERHYEERPPMQWAYQFYRQHRLIVELEKRALGDLQTSASEALAYYQGHQDEFQDREVVQVLVVTGEELAVNKVWTEALIGADLVQAAKENAVQVAREPSAAVPTQELSASIREVLARLRPGDLSQPFLDNGQSTLIKLSERRPGGVASFPQVEEAVKEKIRQGKKALRKRELLETLKLRSTITLHDDVWVALQKKYSH